MNTKSPYRSDEPNPTYLHDIRVNGRRLVEGMEASLERGIGYPAGRYRFKYAEQLADGTLMLQFYGPTRRSKQRYRLARPEAVTTVHSKTYEPEEAEE
jgi:hypothetical protein